MTHPEGTFEDFFHQTYDSVLRYALRRLPGRAQADDVAAEVFASAWRVWQKGDPLALPWLLHVARNKIADHYRRESRERTAQRSFGERLDDAEALSQDDHVDLWRALRRLGEREREALTLAYWDGLSGAEIAQVLGCTPATAWAVLSRGRKRLRKLLETTKDPVLETEGRVQDDVH